MLGEEHQHVREYRHAAILERSRRPLPAFETNDPQGEKMVSDFPDGDIDLGHLVELRRKHQTRQAELGLCKRSGATRGTREAQAARTRIRAEMESILKEDEAWGSGTATASQRLARWRAPAQGGREGIVDGEAPTDLAAGTAANAAVVAASSVKKVSVCFAIVSVLF